MVNKLVIFILLSFLLGMGAVLGGEVTITPDNPDTFDDLTCSVSETGRFYFVWTNGEESVNSGSSSLTSFILDSSYTQIGETWICYVSKYMGYGWVSFGSASVTIQSMIGISYPPYIPTEENNCPELSLIDNIEVDEGDLVTISATASDEDGDALTYTLTEYGDIDFTGSNPWTWQTEDGDAGEYTVNVEVSDGECIDSQELEITVNEIAIAENNCPVLEDIADITVSEGELVTVELTASDADGDALSYDMYEYADNLVFTENGNIFTWQTEEGDAGSYYILAWVSDGECYDFDYFYINVNEYEVPPEPENSCPILETIEDIEVDEGDFVTISATASDADGDALTYNISESYDNIEFTGSNPWSWGTGEEDDGAYTITVSVSDGECADMQEVEVIVNEITAEVNNCPVLDAIGNIEIDEEETATITASATDADGDALTYSISESYDNIEFTGSNPWSWEADEDDSGEYSAVVSVSDGICSDTQEVKITVNDTEEETKGGGAVEKFKILAVSITNANDLISNYCLPSEYSGAEVQLSGAYAVENGCITDTSRDNEIGVSITMQNKLGSDADGLTVFIEIMELGIITAQSIGTIDDGETATALVSVPIPDDISAGDYSLQITIQGEDVSQVAYATAQINSVGDAVNFETIYESGAVEQARSLWERFAAWLNSIITLIYNAVF